MKWIGQTRWPRSWKSMLLPCQRPEQESLDNERSSKRCQTAPAAQTVRPEVKMAFALAKFATTFATFCTSDQNTSYILNRYCTFFEMNWTRSGPRSEWRLSPLSGDYILTTHQCKISIAFPQKKYLVSIFYSCSHEARRALPPSDIGALMNWHASRVLVDDFKTGPHRYYDNTTTIFGLRDVVALFFETFFAGYKVWGQSTSKKTGRRTQDAQAVRTRYIDLLEQAQPGEPGDPPEGSA